MGYSCSAIAGIVMDAAISIIQARLGDCGGSSNAFGSPEVNYFVEIGREQADGSITGTTFKSIANMCRKAGSFKINGDGNIARFPMMTKAEREQAEQAGEEMFFLTYIQRPEDQKKPMFEVIS